MTKIRVSPISIEKILSDKHLSALRVSLLMTGKFGFLPELMDLIGKENFLKVFIVLAGTTVRFPTPEEMVLAVRDVDIWVQLEGVDENIFPVTVKRLAETYELNHKEIIDLFNQTKAKLSEYIPQEVVGGR